MAKLPAFQFYPADWRKDPGVQSLSFHDRGVWFEILCLMHESEQRGKLLLNGKPMPNGALARLLGLDDQTLAETLTALLDYGVASRDDQGALTNRRMIRDDRLRKKRSDCGKLGGNPNLLNQTPKQKPTPSSSSSTSSSDSDTPYRAADAAAADDPVERRIWKDGIALLSRSGMTEKQARPFLGRLAKDHGRMQVASAIAVTQAANAVDARAYIVAVLQERSNAKAGMAVGRFDPARTLKVEAACLECFDTGQIYETSAGGDGRDVITTRPCVCTNGGKNETKSN